MSVPVIEQIALKIVERLTLVTTANGYSVGIDSVFRPPRLGVWKYADRVVNLTQDDPQRNTEVDVQGYPAAIGWDQPFDLHLVVRLSDRDTTPMDSRLNVFAAEVVKGLTNAADWHAWDGLALLTNFGDQSYFGSEDDASIYGIVLPITVTYRVDETDPYTAR